MEFDHIVSFSLFLFYIIQTSTNNSIKNKKNKSLDIPDASCIITGSSTIEDTVEKPNEQFIIINKINKVTTITLDYNLHINKLSFVTLGHKPKY